ncbi:MAG: TonB-dependent receptor [Balneola sp.]
MKRFALLLFALLIITDPLQAQTKGKIAGEVIDEFGEPLIGVQVFIENTTRGVLTDIDGKYSIVNLDPDKYTVVFSYIGFATTRVQEVEVILGLTTEVDVTLREEVIEGQEIVVTAERPIVEKDRTTTTAYVSAEQLEELPIVSINEAVNQQAGVVDGHFRGGRTGEVSYLVNGVPINNAFNNGASFEVEQNMVSSLEVISGVFNAEYGQALSGVVNIVTKGVSSDWSASLLAYAGTIVSTRELEFVSRNTNETSFLSFSDFSQEKVSYTEASSKFQNQDIQFSIGGPIIKNKLGIQASVRYLNDPGYLIGRDLFRPNDLQSGVGGVQGPDSWVINASGSGDFEELNNNQRYSVNASLVYELNSRLKLDYNIFYQDLEGRNYDHFFKYNPSGINKYYNISQTHILGLRYSIGQNSFANISYSYLRDKGDFYLYDDATSSTLDQRYAPPELTGQQGESAFAMGGNYLSSSQDITQSHTIVTDFTSQINNIVLFKTGLSARFHDLDNEAFGITTTATGDVIRSANPLDNSSLEVQPFEAAGYSQVKLEFENLIVNAGLRFDYFEPDFVVPLDVSQIRDEFIPDPNGALGDSTLNRRSADASFQISPRLGIAFPISETGVMRFSAGLFFQTPQLNLLYTNNEFEGNVGLNTGYGNAELGAERTLQFEVGLQQGLSETMGLDFTLFSKDIRGLAGTQVNLDQNGAFVSRLVNLDYGTIKGATLSLYQRGSGAFSWTIDYTLQFANGSASSPQDNFQRAIEGRDPIVRLNRLNWDRRNVLNNTITWNTKLGLTISAINSLQTGTPYTSERNEVLSIIPNNADKPIWFNSDARVYYKPPVLEHDLQLFLQVDNVFDSEPDFDVYNDTGLATESIDLSERIRSGTMPGGLNSYTEFFISEQRIGPPRSIKIGLSYKF